MINEGSDWLTPNNCIMVLFWWCGGLDPHHTSTRVHPARITESGKQCSQKVIFHDICPCATLLGSSHGYTHTRPLNERFPPSPPHSLRSEKPSNYWCQRLYLIFVCTIPFGSDVIERCIDITPWRHRRHLEKLQTILLWPLFSRLRCDALKA